MKILLLGGTGAMGAYLTDVLAADLDNRIVVTSRRVRTSPHANVSFLCGNAREDAFLAEALQSRYDVVVDFMNYGYDEFAARYRTLLGATGQYVFLSSARVYDRSPQPLTESAPRLLETSTDAVFLATQRYALRKARQEDFLLRSGATNYTIVRPYKTFSEERLQLGAYEKEQWLLRALDGKSVPVRAGLLARRTTLTYGLDVSQVMARLVGLPAALGACVQIATLESLTWLEIAEIYRQVLAAEKGVGLRFVEYAANEALESLFEGGYQVRYDVLWDRTFDSSRADALVGPVSYTPVRTALRDCLTKFLREGRSFLSTSEDFARLADAME